MTQETYCRVIPRDFFNEAKLLKCLGQLAIKIHECDLPEGFIIDIEESGDPFDIQLSDEGSLYVANYPTTVNGVRVRFKTTYNSKSPYPLFCEVDYTDYQVFEDNGEFCEEFINMFN